MKWKVLLQEWWLGRFFYYTEQDSDDGPMFTNILKQVYFQKRFF